jgi:hypothetical protein
MIGRVFTALALAAEQLTTAAKASGDIAFEELRSNF